MTLHKFVDQYKDENILSNLTQGETRAFVDLLILTVMADNVITEEELEGLAEQWGQLPFADDSNLEDMMGEHGYTTREYLEACGNDDEAISKFLVESTEPLKTHDVKMAALRMVAIVSLSDGVDETEQKLVRQLGSALDLEESEIEKTITDILEDQKDE